MNGPPPGPIRKLAARLARPIEYSLPIGSESWPLRDRIGQSIALEWLREIRCIHCDRPTRKSFNQGYCYPCFRSLARCDRCVTQPELCHYARGTCREPAWGEQHCLIPHTVYLANASSLKVGVTRGLDPTARWIDQGASQGLAIRIVPTRLDAGRVEVAFKRYVGDRTDWRRMLRGDPEPLDLARERDRLLEALAGEETPVEWPGRAAATAAQSLEYPVLAHPEKPVSIDLERTGRVAGTLMGIKGQYLMLDTGVINVRKYAGYVMSWAD